MPLTKAKGNMYEFCTHTHSHLAGACPHACSYCYVQAMAKRFPNTAARWTGPVRLIPEEFRVKYGTGRTIFIEHMSDLFAEAIPGEFIRQVMAHCAEWPDNTYVFQTKNPARLLTVLPMLPPFAILGITLESDVWHVNAMGAAPKPAARAEAFAEICEKVRGIHQTFVTVEPILEFTDELQRMLIDINPTWVNIGADSKGSGLTEPTAADVLDLIDDLVACGIEVREKSNLKRLLPSRGGRKSP